MKTFKQYLKEDLYEDSYNGNIISVVSTTSNNTLAEFTFENNSKYVGHAYVDFDSDEYEEWEKDFDKTYEIFDEFTGDELYDILEEWEEDYKVEINPEIDKIKGRKKNNYDEEDFYPMEDQELEPVVTENRRRLKRRRLKENRKKLKKYDK